MKKFILPFFFLIYTLGISQDTLNKKIVVKKLENINSTSDELMPIFSHDGKTMYFVRGFHPLNEGGESGGQDIWYSERQADSSWGSPIRFEKPLNNVQDNSVCGISKDGKTLYLDNIYDRGKHMHPGLSSSSLEDDGKWSKPKAVTVEEFNPKPPFLEFSFPAKFPDIMIISMENEDTTQKEDLYISRRESKGNWKKPVHMGAVLNTAGYEIAPFLTNDGKTLYFASNGHGGEGGSDIFKSTRLDNSWTNWSKPENLGPIINTPGFEAYYSIDTYGRSYFARGNISDGDDDIYTLDTLDLTPKDPKLFQLEMDTSVTIVKGPPFDEKVIIYFEYDKHDFTPHAYEKLDMVVEALKSNSKRRVDVTGHACDLGASTYNLDLSKKRTNSVREYLVARGIDNSRINTDSKGFSQPKVVNISEVNRALNRRAEIYIFE